MVKSLVEVKVSASAGKVFDQGSEVSLPPMFFFMLFMQSFHLRFKAASICLLYLIFQFPSLLLG